MNRIHRRRLIQVAVVLGLTAALPASAAQPVGDDMSMGAADAKVTVIEYGSASCTHCARFNNDIFPGFKAKYVDTGQVRYVFREFLTEPVNLAAASFLLARCAGKDKYFSVLDAIFHAQAGIYKTGDADAALNKIAKDAGLSDAQANACLSDKGGDRRPERPRAGLYQQRQDQRHADLLRRRRTAGGRADSWSSWMRPLRAPKPGRPCPRGARQPITPQRIDRRRRTAFALSAGLCAARAESRLTSPFCLKGHRSRL